MGTNETKCPFCKHRRRITSFPIGRDGTRKFYTCTPCLTQKKAGKERWWSHKEAAPQVSERTMNAVALLLKRVEARKDIAAAIRSARKKGMLK